MVDDEANHRHSIQRLLRNSSVVLAANAMVGDRERYLKSGMDDYLAKPFKRDSLKRIIPQTAAK